MASTQEYDTVKAIEMGDVESTGNKHNVTLEWKDIQYKVKDKTGTDKQLLYCMSGVAAPGQLLGIMGTSGAGKSTLLDVLAGRITSKGLTGAMMVNGTAMDKDAFKKMSGYVMQSDALFPLLTVRETIRYAAYLRCADKTTAERNELAERTISLLKLEKAADTIVGDDMNRGLSGGERRRVSIGVDIVSQPSVIFLDEPTSGLDSSTAYSVVDSLRELARNVGCTIVMTIHQPSAKLFDLLDNVIFLSGGRITYNGSIAKLPASIADMAKIIGIPTPQSGNLPEIVLDLCDTLQETDKISQVTDKWAAHKGKGDDLDEKLVVTSLSSEVDVIDVVQYANSMPAETMILVDRAFKNVLRVPELFFARIGASVGFGVLISTLFLNTSDDILGIQHRLSYFVFTCAFYYYTSLEALPIFLAEREIFQREFSRGAYRAASYTLAQTLTFFPPYLIVASVYTIVTWWIIGLPRDAGVFFFQILTVFTILCAGNAFATLVSTVVPSAMVGQTAGSALFSIMFLFSGFFIKTADIPDYWIYLHYLSLFKYSFDSLISNDLSGVTVVSNGVTILDHDAVLKIAGIDPAVDRGRGIWVLWIFIIGFRVLFWHRLRTAFTGLRK